MELGRSMFGQLPAMGHFANMEGANPPRMFWGVPGRGKPLGLTFSATRVTSHKPPALPGQNQEVYFGEPDEVSLCEINSDVPHFPDKKSCT